MRVSTEQERKALKSAVRLALKLAGGPERFSHVTAVKCPELSKYASASEDRQARIDVALELDREAGAPVVLGEMARLLGYSLGQGERRDTAAATLADASRVARECLDVFNVVIEALADGRIDPTEGRACRQQIAEAIRELAQLDARIAGVM
jgi:sugar phosphate isomerase/epimerase